jgi:hypothetical protein
MNVISELKSYAKKATSANEIWLSVPR